MKKKPIPKIDRTEAKSIALGGRVIKAENALYDTYKKQLTVCCYCGQEVLLCAKQSTKRSPYWRHFPGVGFGCVAYSNPRLLNLQIPIDFDQLDDQAIAQCRAVFTKSIKEILGSAYGLSTEATQNLIEWTKTLSVALPPQYQFEKVSVEVARLGTNLTGLLQVAEYCLEEALSNPNFSDHLWSGSGDDKTQDAILSQGERMHKAIYLEMVRYLSGHINILQWLCACFWRISYPKMSRIYDYYGLPGLEAEFEFSGLSVNHYALIQILINLALVPWCSVMSSHIQGNSQNLGRVPEILIPKNSDMIAIAKTITPTAGVRRTMNQLDNRLLFTEKKKKKGFG